ncbi:hypothetical protein BC835DRAFT_1275553, partial [Cytidiella melzeri]
IRASGPVDQQGRCHGTSGVFDPVLVVEDAERYCKQKKGLLDGLCAARIRVIFELPAEFSQLAHPLVYLEWYTPFH